MNLEEKFNLDLNRKNVLYVDANNLFFRAYYAAKAANGNPLHFLLNMAYSLKMETKSDFMFAIFDGETSKQSRLKIFPEYKNNREKKDEEEKEKINSFIKMSRELFEVLGYVVYHTKHIEADDVIGILSRRSIDKNFNVIAVSSDKDYKQLCQYSPYINIYNSQSDKVTNQYNFHEQHNIKCEHVVDYLSLTGDNIDGISGVEKVGPKTAEKWLNEIGGIEEIKNNLDKIKDGKTKENLIEAINNGKLNLNKKLIEFHFDKEEYIDINKEIIKPAKSLFKIEKLDEFCISHGFKQFREKYIDPLIKMGDYSRTKELQDLLNQKIKSTKISSSPKI